MNSYSNSSGASNDMHQLASIARQIRLLDLETVYHAGAGHIGGEMSAIDLLTCLYFHILRIDPANPQDPERDRFILSKGHTACALYATLAVRGFFEPKLLQTFLLPHSTLNGHPNRVKVPGVETSTGPLGHGLPVGVGMAKAAKIRKADWRVFVLCGDGELQEGSNWEAVMAAAQFKLDNLTVIIDHNRLQQGATLAETNALAPISDKFSAFGWTTCEVDGHNISAICSTLSNDTLQPGRPKGSPSGHPRCVIAHTFKGQGISFMRDRVEWHHKVPNAQQYAQAKQELESIFP